MTKPAEKGPSDKPVLGKDVSGWRLKVPFPREDDKGTTADADKIIGDVTTGVTSVIAPDRHLEEGKMLLAKSILIEMIAFSRKLDIEHTGNTESMIVKIMILAETFNTRWKEMVSVLSTDLHKIVLDILSKVGPVPFNFSNAQVGKDMVHIDFGDEENLFHSEYPFVIAKSSTTKSAAVRIPLVFGFRSISIDKILA